MTYALAVVVALVLVLPSDQWWRWGRPKSNVVVTEPSDLASLPLRTAAQVFGNYLGGARYPTTQSNGSDFAGSNEGVMTLLDSDSLYVNGGGKVTVLTLPAGGFVNTSNWASMNSLTYEQGFIDTTEGNGAADLGPTTQQGWQVGGLLLFNGVLHGSAYSYYDTSNQVTVGHYKHSATLATTGVYAGMVAVWDCDTLKPPCQGYTAGYKAHVPVQWQEVLGGPAVTGQTTIPITSRTSQCPALFSFNPDDVYVATPPITANALMWCDGPHSTWGPYSGASPLWGGASLVRGVAIIKDTRTTIFLGTNGTGTWCYGGVPPCVDPENPSESGNHSYPYRYQYWLVDTLHLAEVKAGTRMPWNVLPYAYGELVLPTTARAKTRPMGMVYDETLKRLYFTQARAQTLHQGELGYPILHGWQLP